MNCKEFRRTITDLLANSAAALPPLAAAHQQSCASCCEYYASETKLFSSISTELQSIVNAPIPPSLVPAVRTQLENVNAPSLVWATRWSFAIVAVIAVLLVSFAHTSFRAPFIATTTQTAESVPALSLSSGPASSPQPKKAHHPPGTKRELSTLSTSHADQVIVLPEERRAFAEFVAQIPQENQTAIALTHPAPALPDIPIEIASLNIDDLQWKPLDGTATQEQPKSTR